jgi:hypothetical protein
MAQWPNARLTCRWYDLRWGVAVNQLAIGPVSAGQGYFMRRNCRTRHCARTLFLVGVAATILVGAIVPADAGLLRRPPHKGQQVKKDPSSIRGPLIIAISIARQRLTVFDDGVAVAQAPVSTGMAGHSTPMVVFSVIQKEKYHRSNIYSGAPMPYMQRITWSGVAMHAGVLPGYPASHGCIRMPYDFAIKLYGMTRSGARVIITRNEVTPFDFEHSRLALLKTGETPSHAGDLRPSIDTGRLAGGADRSMADRVRTADASAASGASMVDAAKSIRATPAGDAPAGKDVAPAAVAAPAATTPAPDEPVRAVDAAKTETTPAASANADEALAPAGPTTTVAAPPQAGEPARTMGEAPVAPEPTISAAPEPAGPAKSADGSEPAEIAPASDATATIKGPASTVSLPAAEASKSAEPVLPSTAALLPDDVFVPPSRPTRPLRTGPISMFVSRKEGKLFVRKGFDPLFAVPVTIAHPDQPIGTHVFTAIEVKEDGASLRWLAVTLPGEAPKVAESPRRGKPGRATARPVKAARDDGAAAPPQTATEALDRIELSPELVQRISALMSVGASFIISDQGLGYETGLETDFIVVTR